ncbi:hypothetical protein HMJ29_05260 [Hymenobacter taeanensis]|uniref:Uncharacterized protein n=1 Tax=Hymenobacter taeanensis TaxID=2735321 RepID=A0A6M6BF56_9BACT|nr:MULTISPECIES: hypothetical protein [Hymenobacter]QJX46374.1 hypothetical protein HMJ29_05260 [Hymenobacter taeanensis]UOQ80237.1 hypothetical protein MUN83_15575 [Hymenobacter sp. 5414T-23]
MNDNALWYLNLHKEHDVKLRLGAGMVQVTRFTLNQKTIQDSALFLINRANVI